MTIRNPLEVKYGSIYNDRGCIIETMGIMIDKTSGLMKYGNADKVLEYFEKVNAKFRDDGFDEIANDLMFVKFDKYEGVLSSEEICTFVNYIVETSANGENIVKMLYMESDELKGKLKVYKDMGY